jgi:hypothetical protein
MYRTSFKRGMDTIPQYRASPLPASFVPRPSKRTSWTRPTTRPPLPVSALLQRRSPTQKVRMSTLPMVDGLDRNLAGPLVNDPPILQQAVRFDAPSLTIYIGPNKVALIPALLSAIAVKLILFGGAKMSEHARRLSGAKA